LRQQGKTLAGLHVKAGQSDQSLYGSLAKEFTSTEDLK
jgi:lambda repressor-like predicted transcriptional regulator